MISNAHAQLGNLGGNLGNLKQKAPALLGSVSALINKPKPPPAPAAPTPAPTPPAAPDAAKDKNAKDGKKDDKDKKDDVDWSKKCNCDDKKKKPKKKKKIDPAHAMDQKDSEAVRYLQNLSNKPKGPEIDKKCLEICREGYTTCLHITVDFAASTCRHDAHPGCMDRKMINNVRNCRMEARTCAKPCKK